MKPVAIVVAIVATAGVALADKPASLDHYNRGRQAYAAGNFTSAIDEFEHAYREFPAPEYLHDIAQAMKRLDRCGEAVMYFERFLVEKPAASNRAAIESQVAALRQRCPQTAPAPAPAPAAVAVVPATEPASAPVRVAAVEPAPAATTRVVTIVPPLATPSPWSGGLTAGVTFLGAGAVVMPPVGELDAMARYEIVPRVRVGAGIDLARIPYSDASSGTAWLAGPEVAIETDVPIRDRLAFVGGAALGTRTMFGLGTGNPFVAGDAASGAITMLLVRAEAGVTWAIDRRFTLRALPLTLEYSPRRSPLASDIGSLRGLGLSIGVDIKL